MPEMTMFNGPIQRTKGLRNAWLLNVWRMRRVEDHGLVIDYFIRKGVVIVCRIRMAVET